jgi:hypothetical protein
MIKVVIGAEAAQWFIGNVRADADSLQSELCRCAASRICLITVTRTATRSAVVRIRQIGEVNLSPWSELPHPIRLIRIRAEVRCQFRTQLGKSELQQFLADSSPAYPQPAYLYFFLADSFTQIPAEYITFPVIPAPHIRSLFTISALPIHLPRYPQNASRSLPIPASHIRNQTTYISSLPIHLPRYPQTASRTPPIPASHIRSQTT